MKPIPVNKDRLLVTLHKNLEEHQKIVSEARTGYLQAARKALLAKMAEVDAGKFVPLTFNLSLPQDYSDTYKNAIAMLEWTTQDEIELGEAEFRQLVRNEFSWQRDFLSCNSVYSSTASGCLASM